MTLESKIPTGAVVTMDSGARALACIVMAGGKGTRMRSALPKVLHATCGRPTGSNCGRKCRSKILRSVHSNKAIRSSASTRA